MLGDLTRGRANERAGRSSSAAADTNTDLVFGRQTGARQQKFHRNEEIFAEGDPAVHGFKVLHGAVRSYKILRDGRRFVNAFHMPGEFFGFEPDDEHWNSAEAVGSTTLAVVRRDILTSMAEDDLELSRVLVAMSTHELRRTRDHALLLVHTAEERVAAFLADMAQRNPGRSAIDLPMTRQDIADFLGLTIYTVSRAITRLTADTTIDRVASRRIMVRDMSALTELNA